MRKINICKVEIGNVKTLVYIQKQSLKDTFGQIIYSEDLEEYSSLIRLCIVCIKKKLEWKEFK